MNRTGIALIIVFLLFECHTTFAQVGINNDGSQPDDDAMLDIKSTTKGLLPPRLSTSEMYAITSPPAGLLVYNTTTNTICFYDGSYWRSLYNKDGESCGPLTYGLQGYQTVIIGTQCWMAENLNIGTIINGNVNQQNNPTIEKYCYDDLESNCNVFGGLYQWDEMMQYDTTEGIQGICPSGWHIPSDDEWCILTIHIDPSVNCSSTSFSGTDAGYKMKSTSGWNSGGNGSDVYGFTALPAGYRYSGGAFYAMGNAALFWSSTNYDADKAWKRYLHYSENDINRSNDFNYYGYSVRCVKD